MTKSNRWLNEFANNIASQNGEDGIIEKILEVIRDNNKWCVEFGSWDGIRFSNTYNLIKNRNFSGILIEGNPLRFQDLLKTYEGNQRVVPINAFVGFEETDNLDLLLETTKIPIDFDLLSIDIDGNDYHVWKRVNRYKPKVVIIEFNSTIPKTIEFVQPRDMRINQGSSLLSITKLGKEKGYELVAVVRGNAIFVNSKYFSLFGIEDNSVDVMQIHDSITYIFNGYDGTVFVRGSCKLGGHAGILYRESKMQLIPKWLRKYPKNYSKIERIFAKFYRSLYKRGII